MQLLMMEKKVRAGACFFQTQPIFDVESYRDFHLRALTYGARIITGVLLLKSAKQAAMLNRVPGISIPERYVTQLESAEEPEEEGIRITRELISSLKEFANGIHIMAPGKEELVPQLLRN
jgi:5,10-methylenetetrahydrofolate reductase